MYAKEIKMNAKPITIIKPPLISPLAPRLDKSSFTHFAGIFTASFSGLLKSLPDEPMRVSVNQLAEEDK